MALLIGLVRFGQFGVDIVERGRKLVAKALQDDNAKLAAKLDLSRDYANMYGEMAKESNTMVFSETP